MAVGNAVDYVTNVLQYGKRSRSETRVHGFSYENGWTVHRGGTAKVFESARNASSGVVSEVTVMDRGGSLGGVSVPMLEVDTGEVEAAFHSSTVRQFDEDALFYLRSRGGLDSDEALSLFVHGIGEALSGHLERLRGKARGGNVGGELIEGGLL